ncbi:putative hNH nuclease [Mycobacterium xenopi 4042]|uniref:Putative hNH nuclease n=1 Tax=Mycobacterium xenopi 4042 TaxID=1299334 RepID=X7ZZN3_MYCXE|nr:putative hNH nuclease [Mycobacterium xenopi 4042]
MTALLPVAQGVSVYAALKRAADTTFDDRTRGQVMADTLVERVTGRAADVAEPVAVNLVISDETLLGGADAAARIDGYGPIPASVACNMVGAAVTDARSRATLRRLYRHPRSGALVAMESRARRFPTALPPLFPCVTSAVAPLTVMPRSDTATTRCRTAAADRPTSPTGSVRVSAAITSRNRLAGGSPRAWMKPVGTQHNSPHRRGCITTRRHHRNPGP